MNLRNDPKFRRLKVGGYGPFGSAEYWVGRDHLLIVSTSFYAESYRRFFFRDIQAIICQKTRMAMLFSVLSILCLILSFVIGAAVKAQTSDEIGLLVFCAICAVLSAAVLIVNAVRGDTCAVQLTTAVQNAALPCLTRWRKAQRLVEELKPLVLAAQSAPAPAVVQAASTPVDPAITNG